MKRDDDLLFDDEEETIAKGFALLQLQDNRVVRWESHYKELLDKYRKLVLQTRRLIRIGDASQMELLRAREEIEFHAAHDYLTRLWNRAAIMDLLAKELQRGERNLRPPAFIMVDVDCFKSVNDRYGHPAGDAVLCESAKRLETCVRSYDFVGRFGGDEFAVVAPHCDSQGAVHIAERIRAGFSDEPLATACGLFPVTLSLGVAVGEVEKLTPDTLIHRADQALYQAKSAGRNRAILFSEDRGN